MPRAEIAAKSDPGQDPSKQINEDAWGEASTAFGHLAFVCDGMGGHVGGREASDLASKTILAWFASAPVGGSPRDVLRGAIEEANRRIYRLQTPEEQAAPGQPQRGGHAGSTCVAVLVHEGGTEVAHVGDSRAYLLHQGQIAPLTKDHSRVQQMVDAGMITPEEAAHHPEANQITRALGIRPEVEVELRTHPVSHLATDVMLLSSDGLTDLVKPDEILRIISGAIARGGNESLTTAVAELVDLANVRGGHDNITAVAVRPLAAAMSVRVPPAATVTEAMPSYQTVPVPPGSGPHLQSPQNATQVGVPLDVLARSGAFGPSSAIIPPHTPPAGVRRKKSNAPFIVLGLLAFLAVVAVAAVLLYTHLSSRSGTQHSTLDGGLFGPTPDAAPTSSASSAGGPVQLQAAPSATAAPTFEPLGPLNGPAPSSTGGNGGGARPHNQHPH